MRRFFVGSGSLATIYELISTCSTTRCCGFVKDSAGLSNKLDRELDRGKPGQRSHGKVIRAAVKESKLLCKVIQRVESMAGIRALPVFAVAAHDLAVMPRGVGMDHLVPDV